MVEDFAERILFPYTTLFRSARRATGWHECAWSLVISSKLSRHSERAQHQVDRLDAHEGRDHPAHAPDQDRKSTRLNSSHLGISYAVYCLKKKKIRRTQI